MFTKFFKDYETMANGVEEVIRHLSERENENELSLIRRESIMFGGRNLYL